MTDMQEIKNTVGENHFCTFALPLGYGRFERREIAYFAQQCFFKVVSHASKLVVDRLT